MNAPSGWKWRLTARALSVLVIVLRAAQLATPSAAHAAGLEFVKEVAFPTRPSQCSDSLVLYPKRFGTSDVYGYVSPQGETYAVALSLDTVVVLHVPDLVEVGRVAAPLGGTECYGHQHIARTYDRYLYVTSDGRGVNQGLKIIDLRGLETQPPSIRFVRAYAPDDAHVTNHTFDIDTVRGIAYIARQTTDGFRVVDLADPENPREIDEMPTGSIHDLTVDPRRGLLWVAEGNDGYSLYDIADPRRVRRITRFGLPALRYTHNIWPTEDGRFVATTDETVDSPLRIWNVDADQGYARPKSVGTWIGGNRLPHNVRLSGNLAWVASYSYGVSALDITDREHPVEVAHYDTYPDNDKPGYFGAFGVWAADGTAEPTAQARGWVVTGNMDKGTLMVLKYTGPSLGLRFASRDRFDGSHRFDLGVGAGRFSLSGWPQEPDRRGRLRPGSLPVVTPRNLLGRRDAAVKR